MLPSPKGTNTFWFLFNKCHLSVPLLPFCATYQSCFLLVSSGVFSSCYVVRVFLAFTFLAALPWPEASESLRSFHIVAFCILHVLL